MAVLPNIKYSFAAQKSVTPRVIRTSFGDGYSQRVGDGLNVNKQMWTVEWVETIANIDTLEDFLEDKEGATAFEWTPPRQSTELKFICTGWVRGFQSHTTDMLSAEFEQVFDVA